MISIKCQIGAESSPASPTVFEQNIRYIGKINKSNFVVDMNDGVFDTLRQFNIRSIINSTSRMILSTVTVRIIINNK